MTDTYATSTSNGTLRKGRQGTTIKVDGSPVALITTDVGNARLKFRRGGGAWVSEPCTVCMAPEAKTYGSADYRPFVYHSGPAGIDAVPYLVGDDAAQSQIAAALVAGTAEWRMESASYLVQHLYTIIESLTPQQWTVTRSSGGQTFRRATIFYTGGVPAMDFARPDVQATIRRKLTGKARESDTPVPHVVELGGETYELTIERVLIAPQPLGGLVTYIYDPRGVPVQDHHPQGTLYGLDTGAGTTDLAARNMLLHPIEDGEGGINIGIRTAAEYARRHLVRGKDASYQGVTTDDVLQAMQTDTPVVMVGGRPVPIAEELAIAKRQITAEILAYALPRWPRLRSGRLIVFGGGGADIYPHLIEHLGPGYTVELHPAPLFAVADGLERLALAVVQKNGG
jgi:hypothetical protein